jgi:hypothetical protein
VRYIVRAIGCNLLAGFALYQGIYHGNGEMLAISVLAFWLTVTNLQLAGGQG